MLKIAKAAAETTASPSTAPVAVVDDDDEKIAYTGIVGIALGAAALLIALVSLTRERVTTRP